MARLFGVPHTWWAFALLAVVPLSQGLSHLDISRRQRELDYLPLVLVDVVPQFVVTIAVWPLVVWFRDYRAILWLLIAKAVLGTALSFVFARRPYRWSWEREVHPQHVGVRLASLPDQLGDSVFPTSRSDAGRGRVLIG